MRNDPRGLWPLAVFITIVIAVFIVFVALSEKALAAEEDAAVIGSSIEATFDTAIETDEWGATTFDLHVADLEELWADSKDGSYCETYASVGYFIAKAYDATSERDTGYMAAIPAAIYLIDELPRLNTACLREGF